jgi:hypothetical protein
MMAHADEALLKKFVPLNNQIELLFFQKADTASIKRKNKDCYDLVLLKGIQPRVVYFSNTPSKVAGNMTIAQYVETLEHSQQIENVKPNAVVNMVLLGAKPREMTMIGTLSDARYVNKKFHYTLCPFEEDQAIKEGKLRQISLFVDPIHRWPP